MTEIQTLREKVDKISYPNLLIKKINGEIKGNGFFPGADGMIGDVKKISQKDIMILGQDQDKLAGFEKSKKARNEEYTPTWKNLIKLLNDAKIESKRCIFTNCILGVRKIGNKNTGKSPALIDKNFIYQSLKFLEFQIDLQKPKAIICLGIIPIKLLGYLSKELHLKFMIVETFKEIDERKIGINKNVQFDNISNCQPTIIILTHPSYRNLNVKHRKYKNFEMNEAEIEMLREID